MANLLELASDLISKIDAFSSEYSFYITVPVGVFIFVIGCMLLRVFLDLLKAGESVPIEAAEQGLTLRSWIKGSVPNPKTSGANRSIKAGLAGKYNKDGTADWVIERSQTKSSLF